MSVAPGEFVTTINENKLTPFIGVPCSILAPLINYILDNPAGIEYLNPAHESQAMGIAAGFYLATGKTPVVFMQNSGLGNIMNPLTSLNQVYRIPAFLLVTWRGFGAWGSDAPEHDIPGRDMEKYLQVLHIPYRVLTPEDYRRQIRELCEITDREKLPVAGVVKADFFTAYELTPLKDNGFQRYEAIKLIKESLEGFTFLSTTGFISRESFAVKPSPDFYMVGSMGLIAAIGCGVALSNKKAKVAILDGDGAVLMHLGLLPFIGSRKPENLYHFVLDNGVYGSTQNQPCVSGTTELVKIALASGYSKAYKVESANELSPILPSLKEVKGPVLVWIKVAPGNKKGIGRVNVTPERMKAQFMERIEAEENDR